VRSLAPLLEELRRRQHFASRKPMGNGVLHRRHQRRGDEAARRVEDVARRERVSRDEHPLLGPLQEESEAPSVTCCRLGAALAAAGSPDGREVSRCPGAIGVKQPGVEAAEVDLVELGDDDPGHLAAFEGELERLLRPPELGRHAELDLDRIQHRTKPAGLVDTFSRKPLSGNRARGGAVPVRAGERVADEEKRLHAYKRTER